MATGHLGVGLYRGPVRLEDQYDSDRFDAPRRRSAGPTRAASDRLRLTGLGGGLVEARAKGRRRLCETQRKLRTHCGLLAGLALSAGAEVQGRVRRLDALAL